MIVDERLVTYFNSLDQGNTARLDEIESQALAEFVINGGLCGIDRIVPIGKTADFSLTWDGYDLILQMSRKLGL